MKYLVAVFALVVLASAEEWKVNTNEDLLKVRGECVELKKLSAEHVEKIKKWNFPDDEITHCYLECVFEKMGLFNPQTGFVLDHLVKQLGQNGKEDEVKPEIEKCIDNNEQKTDSCSWVYRGVKCFFSKNLSLAKESIQKKD